MSIEGFWFGVFTGVVGTFFVWLIREFFHEIFLAKYVENAHKITSLAGEWNVAHLDNPADGENIESKSSSTITIKQRGHKVWGEGEILYEENKKRKKYEMEGQFRDNFLLMYLTSKTVGRVGYQTYLLQISEGGDALKGYRSFYGSKMEVIRAVQCELRR